MNKITQTMRFRQALIQYAEKYGVTKAAIRYRVNRQAVVLLRAVLNTVDSSHLEVRTKDRSFRHKCTFP